MLSKALLTTLIAILAAPMGTSAEPVEVNVENFIRAETDQYMARSVAIGGFGRLFHLRFPTAINQQTVIRMNRDTIYSAGIFDLTTPVTLTMPEGDGRFQSLQAISQDHYTITVKHDPGSFTFTQEDVGTRYLGVIIRTFVDPNDEADITAANRMQDEIGVRQEAAGTFDVPDWDPESLGAMRGLLLALGEGIQGGFHGAFGSREEVDPIRHLIGTAAGWGGNPPFAAVYSGGFPAQNDGVTPHAMTFRDVPVDGFWSITVYNGDGFMEHNVWDVYSFNGVTAEPNGDGSVTVHFGGCEDGRANCIPIMNGWNYVIRLYRPRAEILDGTWSYPDAVPVQ